MAELHQHQQEHISKYSDGANRAYVGSDHFRRFYAVSVVVLAIGIVLAVAASVLLYLFQLPIEFLFLPLIGLFLCLPALGYFIGRLKKQ